ncbi:cell division protein ZipA [Gallibacterium genomosp. 3]|uniref:Cell division protein ZipA n=1 Tax=Gallibacterium genomosp. 3 TaxID=505345 RepID=A0A1A7PLP5_9PAST|nr:cell division protein ZipA [Gallibacterium genomosp. 3]OBX03458.1 cell division protein ZipA [Gallibacterium genomosp. 3]
MDLQQILILLGVLALGILIGHGFWSSRREKAQFEKSAQQFERQQIRSSHQQNHHFETQAQGYPPQQQGMYQQQTPEYPPQASAEHYTQQAQYGYSQNNMAREMPQQHRIEPEEPYQTHLPLEEDISTAVERRVENIKITLPNSPTATTATYTTEPAVAQTATPSVEPNQATVTSAVEMRAQVQQPTIERYVEPEPEPKVEVKQGGVESTAVETVEQSQKKPEFIMLYVVAPENRQFYGTHINQVLEELGFLFGEYNIYHRHLDVTIASSPIIFSVANMVQPGTFDPNNFDNFATIGLTLFMRLPSPGNDIANFRMLCRAAETLAEKLNGFVLNDKREIFTDDNRNEYLQLLRS